MDLTEFGYGISSLSIRSMGMVALLFSANGSQEQEL
tara:strand:+ start:81 stop:188 length:108 start_codon:yes stop_codon:yes gene_type:complete